jgi:hypothetical protein
MQKAHRCRRLAARLACALLLLASLLLLPVTITTNAAGTEPVEVLGHFGGNPTSLTKLGRFLLGREQQGFVVFDVADPTQIQPYAHVALPATTRAYQVEETTWLLAADGPRLYALVQDRSWNGPSTHAVIPIDISDPDLPRLGAPYWLAPELEVGTLAAGDGIVVAVDVEHAGPGLTGGLTQLLRWPDINTPQFLARITTGDRSDAALIDRGRLFLGGCL